MAADPHMEHYVVFADLPLLYLVQAGRSQLASECFSCAGLTRRTAVLDDDELPG